MIFPRLHTVLSVKRILRFPSDERVTDLIPVPSLPLVPFEPFTPTTTPRFSVLPFVYVSISSPFEFISDFVIPIPSVPLILPRLRIVPFESSTLKAPSEDTTTLAILVPSFPSVPFLPSTPSVPLTIPRLVD